MSHSPSFVVGVGEGGAHLLDMPKRNIADMARVLFVTVRRLDRDDIIARLTQGPQRGAEQFIGFGHDAEEFDEHQLKGEDLALNLDFEVLKSLTGLHGLRLSDLDGVPPLEWYVPRYVARWPEGKPWPETLIPSPVPTSSPMEGAA